jgi:hypothetical protein
MSLPPILEALRIGAGYKFLRSIDRRAELEAQAAYVNDVLRQVEARRQAGTIAAYEGRMAISPEAQAIASMRQMAAYQQAYNAMGKHGSADSYADTAGRLLAREYAEKVAAGRVRRVVSSMRSALEDAMPSEIGRGVATNAKLPIPKHPLPPRKTPSVFSGPHPQDVFRTPPPPRKTPSVFSGPHPQDVFRTPPPPPSSPGARMVGAIRPDEHVRDSGFLGVGLVDRTPHGGRPQVTLTPQEQKMFSGVPPEDRKWFRQEMADTRQNMRTPPAPNPLTPPPLEAHAQPLQTPGAAPVFTEPPPAAPRRRRGANPDAAAFADPPPAAPRRRRADPAAATPPPPAAPPPAAAPPVFTEPPPAAAPPAAAPPVFTEPPPAAAPPADAPPAAPADAGAKKGPLLGWKAKAGLAGAGALGLYGGYKALGAANDYMQQPTYMSTAYGGQGLLPYQPPPQY